MMKSYKLAAIALTTAGICSVGQAQVEDFTEAEGYVNGSWVTAHPNWNGTETNNVVDTAAAGYDGATGIVTLTDEAWVDSVYNSTIDLNKAGDTIITKTRFRYTTTAAAGTQRGIFTSQLEGGTDSFRMGLRRASPGNINLFFQPTRSVVGSIAETDIGITSAGDTSDWLELTWTLRKGSDTGTNDFYVSYSVSNLYSGVEVAGYVDEAFTPPAGIATNSAIGFSFGSGWDPALTGTTNRMVDRFEMASTNIPVPTVVIGGSTGNGDFESGTGTSYLETDNWSAMGADDTVTARSDATMNWNGGGYGGYPFNNRHMVNNTGYTVQKAGEIFSLSYKFATTGAAEQWEGVETNITYLFTTSVPVDENITTGDRELVVGRVETPITLDPFTQNISLEGIYVTTSADVGKTFYLGSVFIDAGTTPATNARADDYVLTVLTPSTPWDDYVDDYGLSGDQNDDNDLDGENDWYEYVLGGDPTNSAVQAIQPRGESTNIVFSIRGDENLAYSILHKTDLVLDSTWTTNGPYSITINDGYMNEYTESGNDLDKEFMKLLVH